MASDAEIHYTHRSPFPRWVIWVSNAVGLLFVLAFIAAIVRDRPPVVIAVQGFWVLLFALGLWLRRHPATIAVTAQGIKLPLRRQPIPWSDVAGVQQPGPYHEAVVLNMQDGTDKRIPLPSRYAEQVALIGSVPYGNR